MGRSPFGRLLDHMAKAADCVGKIKEIFLAVDKSDQERVESLADEISKLEHAADLTKNEIRNSLTRSMFMPVERGSLLEILALQDSLADCAEDIAVLLTLQKIVLIEDIKDDFHIFLEKNLECFTAVHNIIKELEGLLESSFGGKEAEKVVQMVDDVAYREHEVDVIQRELVKKLFSHEADISYGQFILVLKVIETVGALSNLSEKLANRVRMTLDQK